jgi:dTDP-4-amino-4,6-dideoxygalactose transaminase
VKQPIAQASPLAEYQELRTEIDAAVAGVLSAGRYLLGPETAAFERELAAYTGVAHALGLASGTDAIHLGLRALGVGRGDEVVTTPHTATATIAAIDHSGATPVLADIDPETYTLDPRAVERVITARTKVILPVHLFGHPADLAPLADLAARHGLLLLEDCAQAHGARYRGKRVGSFGHAAAFSFYPTKNLGAIGDGGMLVTSDPAVLERARTLREYGWKQRFVSEVPGWNSRLDEIQAAILRVKLRQLDHNNDRRRALASIYTRLLAGRPGLPSVRAGCEHAFHLYVIRDDRRDALRELLGQHQVGTAVHYPVPIHLQPAYHGRLGGAGSFPVAEKAALEILSLPIYPQLTAEAAEQIAALIAGF